MKTKASASFAMAALFSLVTFSAQTAAQTQTSSQPNSHVRYKLIDLGTLGGPNSTEGHQAPIVSNSGAVIGIADTLLPDPACPSDCFIGHAFRWEKGVLTDLGTIPGGNNSDAVWPNSLGQVVGEAERGNRLPNVASISLGERQNAGSRQLGRNAGCTRWWNRRRY